MPFARIDTNVSLDDATRSTVLSAVSKLISDTLGKSERFVMVMLRCDQQLYFAGNQDPAAIVELASIGLPDGTPEALYVDEAPGTGFTEIRLANGRQGYVHKDYLRSQIDYRAFFSNQSGRWLMTTVIAGD